MRIKILPENILQNVASEDMLLDQSHMESIYEIRRLKVAVAFSNEVIEVEKTNDCGQVYIEQFAIWINADEYLKVL